MPKEARYPGEQRPTFVGLLRCPDNNNGYSFLGCLRKQEDRLVYIHGRRSKVGADANSVKAIVWTIGQLVKGRKPATVEIWHEGVCGRCGRTLTVPESIESGIGPVCAGKAAA